MTAKMSLKSPTDLIAAVPYLLGFHPADSVVVLGLDGKKLAFAARGDLDAPDGATAHLAAVVSRQGVDSAAVLGYGPAHRVDGVVDDVRAALGHRGLTVVEALRVDGGRYWSYVCGNPVCCPPDGVPYDATSTEIAALATLAGQVALPSREALVRQVAPVGFRARESMRQATERAGDRLAKLMRAAPPGDVLGTRAVRRAGEAAVAEAMRRHADGGRLTDDEAAWLTALMAHIPVRDYAWERVGAEDWHVELWADVVRRAEEDLVPAPASVLAFAAWRVGHGALAHAAVDRALAANPEYSMAQLMREVLGRGIPPSTLDEFPVPERARAGGRTARRPKRHRRVPFS